MISKEREELHKAIRKAYLDQTANNLKLYGDERQSEVRTKLTIEFSINRRTLNAILQRMVK